MALRGQRAGLGEEGPGHPAASMDLHTHSTFSDGRDSVRRLVERALAQEDLAALALTDHDTANGTELARPIRDALSAGARRRLIVVDGIEVSVSWRGMTLHLLGYFPPGALEGERARDLRELCRENTESNRLESILRFGPSAAMERLRRRRGELLAEASAHDTRGILAEIEAGYRASVARLAGELGHDPRWPVPPGGLLWREILERRGVAPLAVLECFVARDARRREVYADYWREAVRRAGRAVDPKLEERIGAVAEEDCGFILHAEQSSTLLGDAVAAIKAAGGTPVLAHPVSSLWIVPSLEEALEWLVAAGVEGLEAYYPLQSEDQTRLILDFCAARGLAVTGGTDDHGREGARLGEVGKGRRVPVLPIAERLGA